MNDEIEKPPKLLYNRKKIEIQRIRTAFENILLGKLGLKNEIERKIIKTYTKKSMPKTKNQNNWDLSWNANNQEVETIVFREREKKEKERKAHQSQIR